MACSQGFKRKNAVLNLAQTPSGLNFALSHGWDFKQKYAQLAAEC